jgi:hypothetical protein
MRYTALVPFSLGISCAIPQAIVIFIGYNLVKICSRPVNPTAATTGDYSQYNNAGYTNLGGHGRHGGHWWNKWGNGYTAPPAGNTGPGFWTGAGLGGMAGYAMGRNAAA